MSTLSVVFVAVRRGASLLRALISSAADVSSGALMHCPVHHAHNTLEMLYCFRLPKLAGYDSWVEPQDKLVKDIPGSAKPMIQRVGKTALPPR